jgi:VIT1/CCC1 family predicted Fe2+/Mn2+ transporter
MQAEERTGVEEDSLPLGRFGRLIALIAFVTGVFLLTATRVLTAELQAIAVVFIGSVGMVTAMVAFLISMASYVDE